MKNRKLRQLKIKSITKCKNCKTKIIVYTAKHLGYCSPCQKSLYYYSKNIKRMGNCAICSKQINLRLSTSGNCDSCRQKAYQKEYSKTHRKIRSLSALKYWRANKVKLLEQKRQKRKAVLNNNNMSAIFIKQKGQTDDQLIRQFKAGTRDIISEAKSRQAFMNKTEKRKYKNKLKYEAES